MTKSKKLHLSGFIFTVLLGAAMHFVYDISGSNTVVGIFAPVNESVWEHLKMLAFPYLLFSLYEYLVFGNQNCNHAFIKLASLLGGMLFIMAGFYTYSGIIGHSIVVLDILLFVLGVFVTFLISYRLTEKMQSCSKTLNILSVIGIFILIVIFALFTFVPPEIPLFISPVT